MARGVLHGCRRALRNSEQHELLARIARVDDRSEILRPACRREIADVPVAHATAPLVVADEAVLAREELDPVFPDRAFQVVVEVGEPVGGLDERGTLADMGAGAGTREANAIGRLQIPDRLLQTTLLPVPECIRNDNGTFLPPRPGSRAPRRDIPPVLPRRRRRQSA